MTRAGARAGARRRRPAAPAPAASQFPDPSIDYRRSPELYRIGRGETGVLTVEPYKSEILPHWRLRTPREAKSSAAAILRLFRAYRQGDDFVGMDMARKFLQMGYTRARRYARHASGRKYARGTRTELPETPDAEKQESAAIFREAWQRALEDPRYQAAKARHQALVRIGRTSPTRRCDS